MVKVVLLHGMKKTCKEESAVHKFKDKSNTLQQLYSDFNLLWEKSLNEMSLAYG